MSLWDHQYFKPLSHSGKRLWLCCLAFTMLLALFGPTTLYADVPYTVTFSGNFDQETRTILYQQSQLVALEDRPPASMTSLKRRARADIPHLMQALHSQAYFNAEVDIDVDEAVQPVAVRIQIETGPVFTLAAFHILPASTLGLNEPAETDEETSIEEGKRFLEQDFLIPQADESFDWEASNTPDADLKFVEEPSLDIAVDFDLQLDELGICLGAPARPLVILEAQDALLAWVNQQGYPLAEITKREVVADQSEFIVNVWLYVDAGPLAYLGAPSITGNKKVCERYIRRKILWSPGDLYNPNSISCTFDELECSGLFRSINIELGSEVDEDGLLPVDIIVSEGQQRSVGAGINYSTEFGAGFVGEWQHRNVRGMGETISFKTELLHKLQNGLLTYRVPDFLCKGTDWLNSIEAEHEITESFHETSLTCSSRLHRRLTSHLQGWIGVALKYEWSQDTDNNRHFTLLEMPMQLRHTTADDVLDPSYGHTINLKFTPTSQLFSQALNYYTTGIDAAFYIPMPMVSWITLAGKLSVGSIVGSGLRAIPPPERLYAGTPSTLRGYPYLSVSPLDAQGKPTGGRSLFVTSFEARCRVTEDWGVVGFWEIGNVYATRLPHLRHHQLQSTGAGLRYYTPVGPLRLDFAIPLNRRPGIDPALQVYFSIGQTY